MISANFICFLSFSKVSFCGLRSHLFYVFRFFFFSVCFSFFVVVFCRLILLYLHLSQANENFVEKVHVVFVFKSHAKITNIAQMNNEANLK